MEEKLMGDFKLAEDKRGRFIHLVEEAHAKSSSILSFTLQWKDLVTHYESIGETLLQQAQQLAVQGTETEEARKRVEEQEIEVRVKLEAAIGFLDMVTEKEKEMGLVDSELGLKKEELQAREKALRFVQHRVEECEAVLEGKETDKRVLEMALDDLRKEICDRESERESCRSELLAKERELAKVSSLIVERNVEFESKGRNLAMVVEELQLKEEGMGLVQGRLKECENEVEAYRKLLGELKMEISRKEGELCSLRTTLEEQLDFTEGEMKRVKDLLSSSESELLKKEEVVDSLLNCIREESENLAFKQSEHERVSNLLSSCVHELKEKDEELWKVKEMIRVCNADHETLQKQLNYVVGELQTNRPLLDFINKALEVNRVEISAKEEELSSLEKQVETAVNLASDLNFELEEKGKELEERKKLILASNAEYDLKEKELALLEEKTQSCCKELDLREKELCTTKTSIDEYLNDLDLKKRELDATKALADKQQEDIYLNKVLLDSAGHMIKEYAAELDSNKKELDFVKEKLDASVRNLELKETELSTIETSIKGRDKMLRVKKNLHTFIQSKISECSKELESMKVQTVSLTESAEEFALALESSCKSVELAGDEMKQCCIKIESKVAGLSSMETKLIECQNSFADIRKHVEERAEAVEKNRRELQKEVEIFKSREEKLVTKEKLIEDRVAELEVKEKQLSNMFDEQRNKNQPAKNIAGAIACHSSPYSLIVEPSQEGLAKDEVSAALRESSDPAKMIFDLLKQSLSRPGDETEIRSRILFLEQLTVVSPKVSPEVNEAAVELALNWRGKLGQEAHCSMDALAFLLFLAAFGACSRFEVEDRLGLVTMIADHERAPELCRSLGLVKSIPELIRRLCEKDMHMVAIKFSVAFNLVKDFQPNVLLSNHLSKTRIFEDGKELLESQAHAFSIHLDSLKALSQGVTKLGLDPGFVNREIRDHLEALETILGRETSCLLAVAGLVMKTPKRGGGATVSGNNWPWQSGASSGEKQSNKRQKR